jgi:alkaline phosphatase
MLLIASISPAATAAVAPRNVILFIGDGMGPAHVQAANYFNGGALSFESFPHIGVLSTSAANSSITDSAASATAMATGHKANRYVISEAYPTNAYHRTVGEPMATSLEYSQRQGKSTGLVTTSYMVDATPAAFAAHEPTRSNVYSIADDFVNDTRPNVLFGGAAFMPLEPPGYTVVTDRASMQALDTEAVTMVSGQFGDPGIVYSIPYEYDGIGDLPHLSEMTQTALNILDNDPDGFFLMVEGARIDHSGHENHLERNVHETLEFANAVSQAVAWAVGRDDTLILVTADHETGGMIVIADNGPGVYPDVFWGTVGHTSAHVPIYAWGANAETISGLMDNTDIFNVTLGLEPQVPGDANGDGSVDNQDSGALFAEFGLTGLPGELQADFNMDGTVNLADFSIMRWNFGFGVVPSPDAELGASAPEPATLGMLALGAGVVMRRRRRGQFK